MNAVTTLKAETPKAAAQAGRLEKLAMTTRQFVTFPAVRREVGLPDDGKRKALTTWRAPLTLMLPFATAATEAFEERLNRR